MMRRIGPVLLLGVAAMASAQDFPVEPAKPAATATAVAKPGTETDPAPAKPAFAKTPAAVVAPVMDAAAVTPVPVMAEGAETTPLSLLGQSVKPGTRSELRWASGQSFDGTVVTTPVIVVHGPTVGPRICLTAAVHGDELNGIEIIRRLMNELDPAEMSGTVIGVPIVNFLGYARGSR
ncbi:MAG TPA: succinylglutamate desuccinylase/aspartoacylase family protein, partial [Pseudomonadota bacterium]|nr:succinylglutamate desuccinylase/aspartoacylase family protein [Pseudomonadota bacterium]